MTTSRRAFRVLPTLLAAPVLAVAVSVPAANAATPFACRSSTISSLAAERDRQINATVEYGGAVVRTCRDLNGDGRRDALFIITSGGTGGAFWGGIVQGTRGGARLGAWYSGEQKMSYGFYKGRPALAWPVYRRNEPTCCPTGGWKVRRFIASGSRFRALKTLHKRTNRYPLKLKP
ncbi:MAG: hypothetical protein M0P31_18055 [Solirubrobacteraceae bacterium]|nr:hypothetical protein [Solirubrobacteraceae bacterium]